MRLSTGALARAAGLVPAAALVVAGCSPVPENVVLIEASAADALPRGAEVVVRASLIREGLWTSAPVATLDRDVPQGASFRVAVLLADPGDALVHLEVHDGDRVHEATRCFAVVGVVRADVELAPLDEAIDPDGDGWPSVEPCVSAACDFLCPAGTGEDCAPDDGAAHPDATDACGDGADQDCDGVDDPCEDSDGDGSPGCPEGEHTGCDCNDQDPDVSPAAVETAEALCENGVDDDCDGVDARCDADGDGVPSCPDERRVGCDCDDHDATIHPGASETPGGECNGRDDNCNQAVDEDPSCLGDDLDLDGLPARCDEAADPPAGCEDDCNDCSAAMVPGGVERCGDGIDGACLLGGGPDGRPVDDDCDPDDGDGDGVIGEEAGGPDCDDADATRHPGAPDRCGDGLDADCSGNDTSCDDDADGDGYAADQDCDDTDPGIAPGLADDCDGVDTDCDGIVDEDLPARHGCVAGVEVDFDASLLHCGSCRAACNAGCGGSLCRADGCGGGECLCGDGGACDGGPEDFCCPGAGCRDLGSDPDNCGACGLACPSAECRAADCVDGECGEARAPDGTACSGGRFCCGGDCAGACAPDAEESRPCGRCGQQTRTCGPDCTWGAWSGCADEGPCGPGQTQSQACGNCGSQARTCTAECQWGAWGGCAGEGECDPAGPTRSGPCGECGTQDQACADDCTWQDVGGCDNTPAGSCDDGDACTADTCDPDGSCSHDGCRGATPICCGGVCGECCGADVAACGNEPRCADWVCGAGQCVIQYEANGTDPERECAGSHCCNGSGGCRNC